MDLRSYNLSSESAKRATEVLNYQPFIVTDDVQTGAAYSWIVGVNPQIGADPRVAPPCVFRREDWVDQWERITRANRECAALYDGMISEIAKRYPSGSFLDVACNNGYFPVAASLQGMSATGFDMGPQFGDSVAFLNQVTGAFAEFSFKKYEPGSVSEPDRRYDVVSASAIMCHLPDPLHFLKFLGAHAREAILFWGQVIDTEHFITAYNKPHPELSESRAFPYSFNDNTRVSIGLFRESVRQMGFRDLIEIPTQPGWLWHDDPKEPDLESELRTSHSRHMILLAVR